VIQFEKPDHTSSDEYRRLYEHTLALNAAAHNFYVTVKPWLHHESDFLKATIQDLKYMLAKMEKDGVYHY